ncbi:hypothetical protein TVAG_446080 [Trichomonas vaginalis G3]|uniref:Uncharacterized protein n=1 Tax=Trichomonas vaginalis (strain ATCC PRA-98 / G3) TaxID=412133 RepID=A2FXR7_TRIV3|nr:hypothetical protein TVAGG3_1006380 [Trichomonas vaginalis G3]EAX90308.1 hypothetical protein TVAG_446080 [Trichomonas vaginalis G3]KAI5491159.1 hypothetical protein TVAGG3_1006380 [Trichomonas vaginalis G3]|eukprot:XP_001303238.1 hypothetical protein [Trichomonas vaginalis G3]
MTSAKDAQLNVLKEKLEKVQAEINELAERFQAIPRGLSDEEIGERLLEAFLNDTPFDRFQFGRQPVKLAMINAAFNTGDLEIVSTCFGFVEQSMTPSAFYRMIDGNERYMNIYNMLHKSNNMYIRRDRTFYRPENLDQLRKMAEAIPKGILKYVLNDTIDVISGQTPEIKFEEVDVKWGDFRDACLRQSYFEINPKTLCSKNGFFSKKWKSAIDPYQGARMAMHWKCPPQVIQGFISQISDNKQKAFFNK